MPKATTSNQPHVLKRNQACHQCRRRKLKCDAQRPCSTCIRSHAHALAHAPAGHEIPPYPDCTFDDHPENSVPSPEGPKSRYERLENRISELEALLRQKDEDAGGQYHSQSISPPAASSSLSAKSPWHGTLDNVDEAPRISTPPHMTSTGLIHPHWPPHLPDPVLLHHLIELFFVFHPHSNRILHAPSFYTSLSLPPNHPKFPSVPLLHAICAIGSLYTAAVSSPPLPDFDEVEPDEIFAYRYRIKEDRPDSFAEEQASRAKETADRCESLGDDLFRVLQARVILSWFYWSHSRWSEVFMTAAQSLRLAVPLGLNMLPPLQSITKGIRPPSILPPARTVIEDETRRNTFWLAYATERLQGLGHGWVHCLDDQDVTQLLPLRSDQFRDGTLVLPSERQWAHSKDLILTHLPGQIDSFILYIKGTIMISHVKAFNMRFRAKHFAGDSSVASPTNTQAEVSDYADPRGSPAFIELDEMVSRFPASFPPEFRNPISDNVVETHLYSACLMPHCAMIILHDPHAEVKQRGCLSALKILTSARSILDLVYALSSTSFDISLLEPFCYFCWFVAGRVLVRFLKAAQEVQSTDQVSTLQSEVVFLHRSIAKAGERIPVAYRFARMLRDLISVHCGPHALPSTTDPSFIDAMAELLAGTGPDFVELHQGSVMRKNANLQNYPLDPAQFLSVL